ncbi:MAG: GNAT family N-acetyltransferase [Clostridia bacterium]|nr:MAG: GNAT family N-acetyltransferase [Clostridia bacterium]
MGNAELVLRQVTIGDYQQITEIHRALGEDSESEYWRKKLDIYTTDPELCIGVESEGKLVGYMLGHLKGGEFGVTDEIGWIEMMAVHPGWQNRGVGRMMVETLFKVLRGRGCTRVFILCSWRHAAVLTFLDEIGFNRGDLIHLEMAL